MEIMGKVQAEQEALAAKAAAAKAAKKAANSQDTAELPAAIHGPSHINMPSPPVEQPIPGPSHIIMPGPIPSTHAPAVVVAEMPQFEVHPEAAEADPNVVYPQTYEYSGSLDLTFICMLSEDPHKALQLAKNMTEITQARAAINELKAVI